MILQKNIFPPLFDSWRQIFASIYILSEKIFPSQIRKTRRYSIFCEKTEKNILCNFLRIFLVGLGDWKDILRPYNLFFKFCKYAAKSPIGTQGFANFWYRFTHKILQVTLEKLSQSEKIVTTRLHGHLLASLLEIENIVFDNDYGKNKALL